MSETGCLKDGHFHNLQVEGTTILGNSTNSGGITLLTGFHYFPLTNGADSPISTSVVQSLHKNVSTGTITLTEYDGRLLRIAQVLDEMPTALGAADSITDAFANKFNKIFGSELTAGNIVDSPASTDNQATKEQVKRLTVSNNANVSDDQISNGAADENIWQVYRLDGDIGAYDCTITLPAATANRCYLFIVATDYVMPDHSSSQRTLKVLAPDGVVLDGNSVSMSVGPRGNIVNFIGKDPATAENLTFTPAADNGFFGSAAAYTDGNTLGFQHNGFIACTVNSDSKYHILHVQPHNTNNVMSWASS